jgi:polysaccharide export outer membrane protein
MKLLLISMMTIFTTSLVFAQKVEYLPATTTDYHLKPGDSVEVLYRYTPEFNQTVTVQENGIVSLQIIGDVEVGGKTVNAAVHDITALAATKFNHPVVSIALKDFDGPHFTVLGEVAKPGRFDLRGDLTLNDAVAIAGGLKLTGKHTQIVLIHRIDETTGQAELLDFRRLENQKNGQASRDDFLKLRNGDLIVVPENKISKIERIVKLSSFSLYYGL